MTFLVILLVVGAIFLLSRNRRQGTTEGDPVQKVATLKTCRTRLLHLIDTAMSATAAATSQAAASERLFEDWQKLAGESSNDVRLNELRSQHQQCEQEAARAYEQAYQANRLAGASCELFRQCILDVGADRHAVQILPKHRSIHALHSELSALQAQIQNLQENIVFADADRTQDNIQTLLM